ncbi:ABC transporter substrate-binding protein [Orenia marismortui]|uniref:Peptide/nickel transport system substrate-binding protein/oligopeptide transport system substrate-binding protein n=1 Tax=Orenia marismortui TaxID=46469 RepID=A0A4R8HRB1_9FIRM|nr:ABC transporter substrate-binding protein [Orenia marismortui]TDX59047.1 peptide/nickel transport system substrate-binding protein/oligopeptide transport system substrate-binding protein [Orenia marismortui]
MFKKLISIIAITLILAFTVVGCGGNQESKQEEPKKEKNEVTKVSEKDKYGGVFEGRISADPPTLDPAHGTDSTSAKVIRNVFDGLVEFNKDLEIIPAIAKSWKVSDDGLTWTFNLRENVKFHNGNKVTADDVIYSFTRLLDPKTKSPRAWLFEGVEGAKSFQEGKAEKVTGLRATDDYTVEIKLTEPFTPFLSVLAMENAAIVSKDAIEEYGEQFSQNPVGTGPFKFVEWKHDSKIVLEKNEDYYLDGRPYLDKLLFRIISEGTSAFAEYEQGNIYQIDSDIPDGQMSRVLNPDGEFADEFRKVTRLGTYYFGFNVQQEPFNNKKVRKAINYAVNKKVIANVLKNGLVKPAHGILPPGMPGYNPDLEGYEYDLEKAKQLLAEAGYPDGLPGTYELSYNTAKAHQRISEAVQASLKKIGINVELMSMDWGTYIQKVDNGNTEIFRMAWIADYPDADNFLHVLFHSDNFGSGGNYSFYKNEEIDKMLDKARAMKPGQKRIELYQEIEKRIMDDAPWVPVYYYTTPLLVKPFVHNYVMTGQDELSFTDVWLEPKYQ